MTRFYFALVLLSLMGLHEAIVTALGAAVVGFTLPPVLVFGLIVASPFLLILANGLPSLFSLLPQSPPLGPVPAVAIQASTSPVDYEALARQLEAVLSTMRSPVTRVPLAAPSPPPVQVPAA